MSKREIESPSPPPETKRPKVCDEGQNDTIYEPLPTGEFIRVLKLQPGETGQNLVCNLEIVDIEQSKGSYEAISYVWGDSNSTIDIQCNGLRVPVTISLADALRNFRNTSEPRALWADALCINQKDDKEKGHQVKRMGEVYANAKRTLVWLGRDDQNVAEDAFALIREANTYFEHSFFQADQRVHKMAPFRKPFPICMDKERWLGVARLFKFSWFRRVWTVQEAAIAKECRMFWGSASINIADALELYAWFGIRSDFGHVFESLVRPFETVSSITLGLYSCYDRQRGLWQTSRNGLFYSSHHAPEMFWLVLHEAWGLEASDPRDHVYAFLGCPDAIDSQGRVLVEADYTSSMDDLNLRLACALMKKPADRPFVLSAVQHDCRYGLLDDMRPSWSPQWHVAGEYRVLLASSRHWFAAGGTRDLIMRTLYGKHLMRVGACTFDTATQHGRNVLRVGARAFDTVIWTSDTILLDQAGFSPKYTSNSGLDKVFIDALWEDVLQSSSQLGITVRQVDLFRSLMIGYPGDNGFTDITDSEQQGMIDAYRKSISVARPSDLKAGIEVDKRRAAIYVEKRLRDLRNASIFLTRYGRIGTAPRGDLVKIGDVCCIVFGATVPFLLTPAKEGRHKLIGECYINGVMNGEIMPRFVGSDLHEYRIVLE